MVYFRTVDETGGLHVEKLRERESTAINIPASLAGCLVSFYGTTL